MLQLVADRVAYSFLGLDPDSRIGAAAHFFIYDSIKILLLLFVMIALVGFLRSYLPQERLRRWLSARKRSYVYASLFGAVTPFCSCSSIPIFIGLLKAGIPLGVAFSFLVTSPLINEYLVVLMIGFFGFKVTGLYVVMGVLMGVLAGALLGRLRLEKYIETDFAAGTEQAPLVFAGFGQRVRFGIGESVSIIRKLWLWILAGVAAGALIHNYVPESAVHNWIGKAGWFSVPLAVVLGVPMYASCAAIVPVAVVLFEKGVPLGTALAFMMAVAALSLPEAILLRRAMKLPLIALFFAVTALLITLTGFFFNFIQTQ